jgi:hypothetical protein
MVGFIQRGDGGDKSFPLLDQGGISPFSLLSNVFENSVFKEMAICQLFKMNRFIQICIKFGFSFVIKTPSKTI